MNMCKSLNLKSFETIDVYHRTRAFGAFLKHNSGWTIAYVPVALEPYSELNNGFRYSGDTLPTANIVKVAYGATLLIHEATLPDYEAPLAFQRAHTTMGQAIKVAEA